MNVVIYNKKIESIFIPAGNPIHANTPLIHHCTRVALANLNNTHNTFLEVSSKRITKPVLNLKEQLQVFKKNLYKNGAIVREICLTVVISLVFVTVIVGLFLLMKNNWKNFKQDILDKKFAYYFYNNDPSIVRLLDVNRYINYTFLRDLDMSDYRKQVLSDTLFGVIFGALLLAAPISLLITDSYDLHRLMKQDRNVDKIEIYETAISSNLEDADFSNEKNEDGFLLDPLSQEPINPEHINYPRYIKLGNHLFTARSFVKALLSHDLEFGRMKHPLQNRFLTDDEQNEILNKFQSLLGIDGSKFLASFNIFNTTQFRSLMNIEQKAAYDAQCLATYRHRLNIYHEWFRNFTPQQQDEYIAANKAAAFTFYRINNLRLSLASPVSLALDLRA